MTNNKKKIRSLDPQLARESELYENPIPSRELILQVMEEHGVPVKKLELIKILQIQENEIIFFEKRIRAMERQGQILINRKDVLCISKKINLSAGRVMGHPDGYGFLIPDDETMDDVFLSPREMTQVFNKDRVMVQVTGQDRKGKLEGKIVEVLERVNKVLVGRVTQGQGVTVVAAEDKRISQDILIPYDLDLNAKTGDIVEVEITTQPSFKSKPMGKVINILGNYSDSGIEIEIALRKHDLPYKFKKEVIQEAETFNQKVNEKDFKGRVDLRNLPLVTIDGETARDFDDAVYAEPKSKGWRLVVAIADVSNYVKEGTQLNESAFERGNSVYFPRRVIPMLPEALSNGLCSLNPNVDRLCMVCDMSFDLKGDLTDYKFYPSVMNSKARLTYTIVDKILNHNDQALKEEHKNSYEDLINLQNLFKLLSNKREERGAIDFDSTETSIIFNDKGKIDYIKPIYRNEAHRIIEECMLSANVCAANYLLDNPGDGIYRNHETPSEEKLTNLRDFLLDFGLTLGGGSEPTVKDYGEILKKIANRPDSHLLQTVLLRSMQQATYSNKNRGHFGLAYSAYTHFTSPIRRYPDLMVHRAIKSHLSGKPSSIKNIEAMALHCSTTERTADDATRDVESWLKCYFMQDKVGQSFWGTVAGVTGFGLFIELDDIYIEGLLHVTELGNDYFTFDKARHAMVGEKTNLTYRLGDRLEIKVIRVDLDSIKIDLALLGSLKKPSKKFKKSFIRSEKTNKKNKRRKRK
ncbi:MAG: ribonuclease R [Nitrosomonadales bacterium]|jgi:ribonuclease R|nr:ribonuclease R [Nitrosomonadales bacterium]MBT4182721.1 ribonuclease R [Nitrosomonadales bacterium]MBT6015086.1 ribonuclease R [Nitrosomonadales bacterium]MBT6251458.1 ribonuclease R [Nitrosomonadales bacterium]MBT6603067.1 ribonuclease R [Nitrosomonadales bacterium]